VLLPPAYSCDASTHSDTDFGVGNHLLTVLHMD
jgi:hypothetical protein